MATNGEINGSKNSVEGGWSVYPSKLESHAAGIEQVMRRGPDTTYRQHDTPSNDTGAGSGFYTGSTSGSNGYPDVYDIPSKPDGDSIPVEHRIIPQTRGYSSDTPKTSTDSSEKSPPYSSQWYADIGNGGPRAPSIPTSEIPVSDQLRDMIASDPNTYKHLPGEKINPNISVSNHVTMVRGLPSPEAKNPEDFLGQLGDSFDAVTYLQEKIDNLDPEALKTITRTYLDQQGKYGGHTLRRDREGKIWVQEE